MPPDGKVLLPYAHIKPGKYQIRPYPYGYGNLTGGNDSVPQLRFNVATEEWADNRDMVSNVPGGTYRVKRKVFS
jgi:hypothetical protein